jgi:hypothetical protein
MVGASGSGGGACGACVGGRRREPSWVKVGADRWVPPSKFKLIQKSKFCSNLVRSKICLPGLKKIE